MLLESSVICVFQGLTYSNWLSFERPFNGRCRRQIPEPISPLTRCIWTGRRIGHFQNSHAKGQRFRIATHAALQ